MPTDFFLRFPDAATYEALAASLDPEDTSILVDPVGVLSEPTGETTPDPETGEPVPVLRPVPGWHVNVRCIDRPAAGPAADTAADTAAGPADLPPTGPADLPAADTEAGPAADTEAGPASSPLPEGWAPYVIPRPATPAREFAPWTEPQTGLSLADAKATKLAEFDALFTRLDALKIRPAAAIAEAFAAALAAGEPLQPPTGDAWRLSELEAITAENRTLRAQVEAATSVEEVRAVEVWWPE